MKNNSLLKCKDYNSKVKKLRKKQITTNKKEDKINLNNFYV